MTSGREALLEAFDRLFVKTADKLQVPYTPDDLTEAKDAFADRMAKILDIISTLPVEAVTQTALKRMETAIDELSPVEVVGQLAAVPLIQHTQLVLQRLAYQAAEQKMIEQTLSQADTTYGGN